MEVRLIKRDKEILAEVDNATLKSLTEIGAKVENHAKDECPVDTGRLWNSITFATSDFQSSANTGSGKAKAKATDYAMHGRPEKDTVVIGTNVEYAEEQEFNEQYRHTHGNAHYLRNAIANHNDEYLKVFKKHYKDVK